MVAAAVEVAEVERGEIIMIIMASPESKSVAEAAEEAEPTVVAPVARLVMARESRVTPLVKRAKVAPPAVAVAVVLAGLVFPMSRASPPTVVPVVPGATLVNRVALVNRVTLTIAFILTEAREAVRPLPFLC